MTDPAPDPTPAPQSPVADGNPRFQCPYCPKTYSDEGYYAQHLATKHAEQVAGSIEVTGAPESPTVLPRTLLQDDALRVCITYDGTNLHQLEEELSEWVRLTQDGPQVKVLVGEDFAEGWMPLHEHHTVVVFGEDAHPFLLTPAAARALGLRE